MTVYCTESCARLDVFLADETEFTRSQIKRLIQDGKVKVGNSTASKAGQAVKVGDEVSFEYEVPQAVVAQNISLDVVYQDDSVAVINKPRGLVVHPGAGNRDGTLVNALRYMFGENLSMASTVRAGIVHRLDKDTTGLIVITKTDSAYTELCKQFSERRVVKKYTAVLDGNIKSDSGVINAPIGRDRRNRLRMAVDYSGRSAITDYTVLKRFRAHCYCEFGLHTGRTHQIRVHCAHVGCPISGDTLYGGSTLLSSGGQLLHSKHLEFMHPTNGEIMSFTVKEPPEFLAALTLLTTKEMI